MGTKAGITVEQVVSRAEAIADRDGFGALTLASVAGDLGIKSPSLYAHVDGLPGVRRALMARAAQEMAARFERAIEGLSGAEALRSVAEAYRRFATEHPGLYEALLEPAPRPGEDDEMYAVFGRPVAVVESVFDELGIAPDRTAHLLRGLRAMLHGFVDVEAKGGFGRPFDVDVSFDAAVDMVITAILSEAEE